MQNWKSFVSAVVFVTILVTLAAGYLIHAVRQRSNARLCDSNLKQIGVALNDYYDTHRAYPSPNEGGHSWRIRCLGFLISSPLHYTYRYDLSWNSEFNYTIDSRPLPSMHGQPFIYGMPEPYACPLAEGQHHTTYMMLVGSLAFGKPNGYRKLEEITDGPESTIAIAETVDRGVHWLEPVDLDSTTMSYKVNDPSRPSISSKHPDGPAVLFVDGAIFRLSPSADPSIVRALVTVSGGEAISREQLLRDGILEPP